MHNQIKNTQLVDGSPAATDAATCVKKALEAIVLVLKCHGYKGQADLTGTTRQWLRLVNAVDGDWMKVAKYKLSSFYSYHNQQRMPPSPFIQDGKVLAEDNAKFLLGGGAGRYLILKISDPSLKESILQSILQSKKGMPRPDKKTLSDKTDEFLTKITKAKEELPGSSLVSWDSEMYAGSKVELGLNKQTVQEQLRRTVRELFQGQTYTWEDRVKLFFPSTSANYIRSRKNAGAVGAIFDDPSLLDGLRKPQGYLSVAAKSGHRNEEDEERESLEVEMERIVNSDIEVLGEEKLEAAFAVLWNRIMTKAKQEDNMAEPVALAEALKTRIITKGPPYRMMVMRNLWKKVHTVLRHHRTFQLVGREVTEEIMLDAMGRRLGKDEVYISGDYADATNNLRSWVSETIAEELSFMLQLSSDENRILIDSLTRHVFEMDDGSLQEQKTGQLMGSITSFPVLCIANAALCRWSMELSLKKVMLLRDLPLLINGDDCAMRGRPDVYEFWHKVTEYAGLEESLGKTYVSGKFVNINSTSFERTREPFFIKSSYLKGQGGIPVERECYLKQTKYVNAGLLMGIKRSSGGVGMRNQTTKNDDLGTRAHELLRLADEKDHEQIMKTFINLHRGVLDKTRCSWYSPTWLGGIGLPCGSWGEPSDLDRRMMTRTLMNWKTERPRSMNNNDRTWATWEQSSKSLPEPVYASERTEDTEFYTQVVAKRCVDLLFDTDISLQDLKTDLLDEKSSKFIADNAKFWNPRRGGVSKSGKLPQPIPLEAIAKRSKYPNWRVDNSEKTRVSLMEIYAKDKKERKEKRIALSTKDNLNEQLID